MLPAFQRNFGSKLIDLPGFFDLAKFITEQVFDTLNPFNYVDLYTLFVSGKEK